MLHLPLLSKRRFRLFFYTGLCLLLLVGCEKNQEQDTLANTIPGRQTPQTVSRIQQIFTLQMLGADRAYLEQFTGVARNTDTYLNQRTYHVSDCDIEVSFAGERITALGMRVNEQCTFELAAFISEKQPPV